jgi:hypothetical protein
MAEDHRAILGVAADASREEILRAYSELVKKCHPDHNRGDPDAEAKFLRIQRAFEMLYEPGRHRVMGAFHTPLSAFLRVQHLPNSIHRNVDSPGGFWAAMLVCLCVLLLLLFFLAIVLSA